MVQPEILHSVIGKLMRNEVLSENEASLVLRYIYDLEKMAENG